MKNGKCSSCRYRFGTIFDYTCNKCIHGAGIVEHFEYGSSIDTVKKPNVIKQPTVPPMPKVKPPKIPDEINHPDRYAGGQYECIDVMVDVFGVQAVRDFCKLNAFKYLWREEKKGGIEDVKKAVWYLEKMIELSEKE